MTDRVRIDPGPLVASLSRKDTFHQEGVAQFDLAERENIATPFTLDRRDFSVCLRQNARALTLLSA